LTGLRVGEYDNHVTIETNLILDDSKYEEEGEERVGFFE